MAEMGDKTPLRRFIQRLQASPRSVVLGFAFGVGLVSLIRVAFATELVTLLLLLKIVFGLAVTMYVVGVVVEDKWNPRRWSLFD